MLQGWQKLNRDATLKVKAFSFPLYSNSRALVETQLHSNWMGECYLSFSGRKGLEMKGSLVNVCFFGFIISSQREATFEAKVALFLGKCLIAIFSDRF